MHKDSYGETASNVVVALHESFVAVIMDLGLSRAEETLIDSGKAGSVKLSREAFQAAISETYTAIVERATGRRVTSFASRAVIDEGQPWALEVFRLDGTPAAA